MTTTVLVTAHCDAKTTRVRVDVRGKTGATFIEDGDEESFTVFDDQRVTVREVAKVAEEEEQD